MTAVQQALRELRHRMFGVLEMEFWRDLSIRRKIIVAYALPFFATCALGLFCLAQMANINDAAMAQNPAPAGDSGFNWMLVVVVLSPALLTACMGTLMLRSVANPLARVVELLSRLSAGDLDVFGGDPERGDEIGALARSLRFFKDEAVRTAALAAAEREARRVRNGQLATLTKQLSDCEDQITGVLNILTAAAVQKQAMVEQDSRPHPTALGLIAPAFSGD